jgi:hypothetical protein
MHNPITIGAKNIVQLDNEKLLEANDFLTVDGHPFWTHLTGLSLRMTWLISRRCLSREIENVNPVTRGLADRAGLGLDRESFRFPFSGYLRRRFWLEILLFR